MISDSVKVLYNSWEMLFTKKKVDHITSFLFSLEK